MSSLVQRLALLATSEIGAGGQRWRIQRVSSRDLAEVHVAHLLMMPATDEARAELQAHADNPDALLHAIRALGVGGAQRSAELQAGLCCAGVRAVAEPDGEWEEVRLVPQETQEDLSPAARPPRMWVHRLPSPVVSAIGDAVRKLSEGQASIAPFRP